MDIKHFYENTGLTMAQIAARTGTTYSRVFLYVKANYSREHRNNRKSGCYARSKEGDLNPMKGKCRELHHGFLGVVGDSKGYLLVLKPEWYTGRKGSKHVFLHSVVMCRHLGITEIPKGYCVHHCDRNPHNNLIENLLMLTLSEHTALHSWTGATTISKESTAKWLEARRAGNPRYDIV